MTTRHPLLLLGLAVLFSLAASGCSSATAKSAEPPALPPPAASVYTATPPPPTATPAPTLPPPSPLPLVQHPYLSGVTEHARQIFLHGQALGLRPDVFSKVGDSITVSEVFLTPIGAGQYHLRAEADLQPVIVFYSKTLARTGNSFGNLSLAAQTNWRAASVLDPKDADPAHCRAFESPLACEYRIVQPAVALIMLGTNDVMETPAVEYEVSLRQVIEMTIEWGIIPVLSTLPPMRRPGAEGQVEQLNERLTRLAREYDIPLWDYGAALRGLPNDGLAADGIHPSWAPGNHSTDFSAEYMVYGMTVRNLTALQALDAVWRNVIAVP